MKKIEFKNFLDQLSNKDAAKLIATIQNIKTYGLIISERQQWIKKLESNLYEIRSQRSSNIQRALYWTKYVITNSFTKKSQKTPESEKRLPVIDVISSSDKRRSIMSKMDEYIIERNKSNSGFAQLVEQENINLEVSVKVRELRENMGMSQREFAKLVGKPQSTIARIENGSMNVSTKVLSEIAQATHRRLTINFSPA